MTAALRLIEAFRFDTVLFPVNWVNYFNGNFGPQVIREARAKGMGCLAIKAMAKTLVPDGTPRPYSKCWYEPVDEPGLAALALRFALTQPVSAAIPPGEPALFWLAVDVAERFRELDEDELLRLREAARGIRPLFRHEPL